MMPINLLPQRERLWQRQRRWWHQRWAWTLGVSLAVWAAAAGALAWQQHQWKNLNAQVQADMDAQAPQRQAHQRWTLEHRQWQDALQGKHQATLAQGQPWHSWQALAQAITPPLRLERLVWNAQGVVVAGHALQAADAAQVLSDWQLRMGSTGVQVVSMQTLPVQDPQGMPDHWWAFEWRWVPATAVPGVAGATPAPSPSQVPMAANPANAPRAHP